MNNLKKKKVLILFFTLAIFCTSVVFANADTDGSRWEKEKGNWYYFDANLCDYVKGDWRKINNIWYYFESKSGVMLSDVIADISGQKYCFDESGAMNTGWKQSNDNWYYFSTNGSMVRNDWQYINGVWYFFEHSTGEMLSGVHREINGAKYYFAGSGAMHTGWLLVEDDWYYYENSGAMKLNGWINYQGKWYYMDSKTGKMHKNTKKIIGNAEYTFNASGEMTSEKIIDGWGQDGGNWKYFVDKKPKKSDWLQWKNHWYYFNASGNMATGWIIDKGTYYYLDSNGIMQTGWLWYNGAWYYLKSGGQMVTGHYDVNNRRYYFNDSGALVSKLVIDVSYFNGNIDWSQVKRDGIDGAILRVSGTGAASGDVYYDSTFQYNAKHATMNNIPIGVYHFSQAINEKEARKEAKTLLETSKNYNITLPYVIDMEYYFEDNFQSRNFKITKRQRTDVILAFFDEIKKHGKKPLLYASTSFLLNDLEIHRIRDLDIWVAQYNYRNTYPFSKIAWQYTSDGRVNGINGRVDMNVWYEFF